VVLQVAFSQIPLSDDDDPTGESSQRRAATKSSPLINVTRLVSYNNLIKL
jgi:hypothetical protein